MPRDICIVHIEDEFHQMMDIPSGLRLRVQQVLGDRAGCGYFQAKLATVASGGGVNSAWVVLEVVSPGEIGATVRYIYTAASEIPSEVVPYILADPYFLVDVLRPEVGEEGLVPTVGTSIESALKHGGVLSRTTIYTAYQGSDLDNLLRNYPGVKVIPKVNMDELELLISQIVVDGLES